MMTRLRSVCVPTRMGDSIFGNMVWPADMSLPSLCELRRSLFLERPESFIDIGAAENLKRFVPLLLQTRHQSIFDGSKRELLHGRNGLGVACRNHFCVLKRIPAKVGRHRNVVDQAPFERGPRVDATCAQTQIHG